MQHEKAGHGRVVKVTIAADGQTMLYVVAEPDEKKADEKKAKNVRGEVVKVDGTKVTLKTKDNKEVVVTTDDKTEVTIEGNAAKLADLKPGQKVVVTPAEGTAQKISVPKPKKAEKKAEKLANK